MEDREEAEPEEAAMVDPAVLHVLAHLNRPPPAIIEPVAGLDGGPFAYAYEILMRDEAREFEAWLAAAPEARAVVVKAVKDRPQDFSPNDFTAVLEPFERKIRREMRVAERLKRSAELRPLRDPLQRRVQAWLFELQRRHSEAAEDLILFLRAMRAEVDPESRGGPTFDNVEDLERYLLSDAA